MRRFATILGLTLVGLTGLWGCGHAAPSARIAEATLAERSSEGMVVAFVIEMENPNPHALPLHEARYQVSLGRSGSGLSGSVLSGVLGGGSISSFDGVRVPLRTLPPGGVVRFEIPVAFAHDERVSAALQAKADAGEAAELPYTLSGVVIYRRPGEIAERLFDARLVRPRARFSDRGRIVLEAPGGD